MDVIGCHWMPLDDIVGLIGSARAASSHLATSNCSLASSVIDERAVHSRQGNAAPHPPNSFTGT